MCRQQRIHRRPNANIGEVVEVGLDTGLGRYHLHIPGCASQQERAPSVEKPPLNGQRQIRMANHELRVSEMLKWCWHRRRFYRLTDRETSGVISKDELFSQFLIHTKEAIMRIGRWSWLMVLGLPSTTPLVSSHVHGLG